MHTQIKMVKSTGSWTCLTFQSTGLLGGMEDLPEYTLFAPVDNAWTSLDTTVVGDLKLLVFPLYVKCIVFLKVNI